MVELCKSQHQATSGQIPEVPDSFWQFVQTALIGIAHLRLLAASRARCAAAPLPICMSALPQSPRRYVPCVIP